MKELWNAIAPYLAIAILIGYVVMVILCIYWIVTHQVYEGDPRNIHNKKQ